MKKCIIHNIQSFKKWEKFPRILETHKDVRLGYGMDFLGQFSVKDWLKALIFLNRVWFVYVYNGSKESESSRLGTKGFK